MWTFDPKIPLGLWWALVFAALAAILWYALRRQWPVPFSRRVMLTLLLSFGMVGPLLVALNPTWVQTIPPVPGNPMLSVLVDGTLSMQTKDTGESGDVSRWQTALDIARQAKSAGSIEVRHHVFSDRLQPLPTENAKAELKGSVGEQASLPNGHRTDLATALTQTTRSGSPLGHAVLIISDGAHNVGGVEGILQSAREANALATPIYTVTLGTSIGMKNMSVAAKTSRMIAFPDSPITLRANIGHNGLAGQITEVALIRDEQVLKTQKVKLSGEPVQEVRFTIDEGIQSPIERYRIAASEVPGEVTTADNQTAVLVQRLNAPIGVLVLEGKPYWDSKFLSRNLARDPVIDLTAIV